MNLSDTAKIPSQVMARQVGDETVILDLASATYFSLNSVGARIWELIGLGHSFEKVLAEMVAEYAVAPDQMEADLLRLLNELSQKGLLLIQPAPK